MWRSALRNAARKPVGGDAVEPSAGRVSSDVPTAPSSSRVVRDTRRDASDALEMHVSVYNLPSALTRRTPRVFVALLVEAPPEARVPTHRGSRGPGAPHGADTEASSSLSSRAPRDAPSRRGNWIVAGCTEPSVVPANARATRFCVPVRVDGLAGPLDRGHLERLRARSKRIALALYRVPDADDADDAYVFADENLSLQTRLERRVTTKRLETMEYLGETFVNLGKVLVAVANENRRDASARDHYALTRNPARHDAVLSGNETNDATNETSAISAFKRRGSSLRKTAATESGPIGLEILAAAPFFHPPPSPLETGRVVADFLVAFPPPRIDPGGAALAAHSAYVRLCRWAGDGYQPVYSSLVCGSEEEVRVEPFLAVRGGEGETGFPLGKTPGTNALVARVPTMHVPIACLRGGGGSTREPGCMLTLTKTKTEGSDGSSREHYPLPSPDAAWRLEVVARLADGRDALVGAAELTPRELAAAGARAALGDGPVALRCDEMDARDFADFDVSSPADGDARAVVLVERWAVRAGTRARQTDSSWGPSTRRGGTTPEGSESVSETFSTFPGKKNAFSFLGKKEANTRSPSGDDEKLGERREKSFPTAELQSSKEETKTNSELGELGELGSAREARVSWTPSSDSDRSASDASDSDEPRSTAPIRSGRTPRFSETETKGYLHIARRARADASPSDSPPSQTDVPSTEAKNASSSFLARRDTRAIMTPTRALLERASLARRRDSRLDIRAETSAVAVAPSTRNASTSRALGLGGSRDGSGSFFTKNKQKNGQRPKTDSGEPSARRLAGPVAEAKFRPDPRLVAAADDAVRAAVADRLQSETRGELVESAMRVRRELLKKLTGELRYLEQRSRREARAGLGVRGQHTASSAAARRKSERV